MSGQISTVSVNEWIKCCKEYSKDFDSLCELTEKTLDKILSCDDLLNDIPYDITQEEISSKIAVAKGQSITIYIKRGEYAKFKIVVPESNTTVSTLKQAIKRNYELSQQRLAKTTLKKSRNNDKQEDKHHHRKNKHSSSSSSSSSSRQCEEYFNSTKISWRWLWRTYFLDFDGCKLTDDKQLLSDYGIVNKSVLKFVKKTKQIVKKR